MPDFHQPEISPYWRIDKTPVDTALELLDPSEFKVFMAVERWTHGHYRREEAKLSLTFLAKVTGLSRNVGADAKLTP